MCVCVCVFGHKNKQTLLNTGINVSAYAHFDPLFFSECLVIDMYTHTRIY